MSCVKDKDHLCLMRYNYNQYNCEYCFNPPESHTSKHNTSKQTNTEGENETN